MKKIVLLLSSIALISLTSLAQAQKFGHIDSQQLLEKMPERDSAMKTLEKEYKDMQKIMEEMQVELNKKYQSYLEQKDKLTGVAKSTKEQELQEMQERFQNYQQTAEQELQKRQGELLKPVMDKAKQAIQDVAKEGGFLYVFDVSAGTVLYYSDKSIDLLPLVKKKLGMAQ